MELPPPQPAWASTRTRSRAPASQTARRRQRESLSPMPARAMAGNGSHKAYSGNLVRGASRAVVGAVVAILRVELVLPAGMEAGLNAQVDCGGHPEKVKATTPLNPFCGVMVNV